MGSQAKGYFCPIRRMTSFELPRPVSWPLTIQRGEAQLSAALAIVFDDQSLALNELAGEFLGPTEFAYFSTLRFGPRQQNYLLGRYAAAKCFELRCSLIFRTRLQDWHAPEDFCRSLQLIPATHEPWILKVNNLPLC